MAESQRERLRRILLRDLRGAVAQLDAYPDEAQIWALPPGVNNSAGTLALHLAGNLRHFIGAQLGGSGYVRQRDAEFSLRDVPRSELVEGLNAAGREVGSALLGVTDASLDEIYPMKFGEIELTSGLFLTHLATHLTYHLGQIDMHRRIVTGVSAPVAALTFRDLVD